MSLGPDYSTATYMNRPLLIEYFNTEKGWEKDKTIPDKLVLPFFVLGLPKIKD
jgi:hypothetical protein